MACVESIHGGDIDSALERARKDSLQTEATQLSEMMKEETEEEKSDGKARDARDASSDDDSSDEEDDDDSVAWAPTTPLIKILTEETHEAFGVEGGDRFVLRDLLGQGGYGAVYRCTLQPRDGGDSAQEELSKSASQFRVEMKTAPDQSHTEIHLEGPSVEGLSGALAKRLSSLGVTIMEYHNISKDANNIVRDVYKVCKDGKPVLSDAAGSLCQLLREAAVQFHLAVEKDRLASQQGREYAVKIVNARRLAVICHCALEVVCPFIQQEVVIQERLAVHPGIVKLKCAFMSQQTGKFFIVGELLRGGDLFSTMVRRGKPLKESEAKFVMTQLCEAVCFCHTCGVVHRDLKLENCLVEDPKKLTVKVCDYGQSRFLDVSSAAQTLTTTPAYTAPEVTVAVREGRCYNAFKADCFALGVMVYCLMCNSFPRMEGFERDRLFKSLSEPAKDFMRKLLTEDPEQRLSAKEALEHPWLKESKERTGTRAPSKAPSNTSLASPHPTPVSTALQAKVGGMVCCHTVIQAIQRERAASCQAVAQAWSEVANVPPDASTGEAAGEDEHGVLFLRYRTTDEQLAQATKAIQAIAVLEADNRGSWAELLVLVQNTAEMLIGLRSIATMKVQCSDKSDEAMEEGLKSIYTAYHPLLSQLISAVGSCFDAKYEMDVRQASPVCGLVSKAHSRYRLMSLATEQLSRERAFVSGYLYHPERLLKPDMLLTLAEMIGARKLLLGNGKTASVANQHLVAGKGGLLPELNFSEASPVEARDLARLEDVEETVLKGKGSKKNVLEWHDLLTCLLDKTHQLVCLSIVDVLMPSDTRRGAEARSTLAESCSWSSQDPAAVIMEFHADAR
mmetsp:Transcript_44976/g.104053  ORF Transcript_44976/g.104053 Transcript_44976/m.104053 type:complete len:848 (-) Transcript_44976:41-2584(-)